MTSRLSGFVDTAVGPEYRMPSRFSQWLQLLPSQNLCHKAGDEAPVYLPVANTSRRSLPQLTTAGSDQRVPSRSSHSLQALPSQNLWNKLKFVVESPSANTS